MYSVWAAVITVGGMVLVTAFNLLGTMWTTRQETTRLRRHLLDDWRLQQYRQWEKELKDCLADLIAAVDPEAPVPDQASIVRLVHRIQLLLDESDGTQATLNSAVNHLALTVAGWTSEKPDLSSLLALQNEVIVSGKAVLFNPARRS